MFLTDLGDRIRDGRLKLGMTQNDLANTLQVSPQAVSKWERGENAPDISLVPKLANLLGFSTDRLLGAHTQQERCFEATVCITDIPGFTKRVDGLDPADVATIINAYYFQVTELVLQYDGVPVKYMGDAFLCYFAGPEHQLRAVKTWFRAKKVLSEKNGVGMSTGPIFLGQLGHPDYARMDIMGDTINQAFRLEGLASKTESGIVASE